MRSICRWSTYAAGTPEAQKRCEIPAENILGPEGLGYTARADADASLGKRRPIPRRAR